MRLPTPTPHQQLDDEPKLDDEPNGSSEAPPNGGNPSPSSDRRSNNRKRHRMMVAMAPLDRASDWRLEDLPFSMVRCVDHSEGGLGIVLPERPTFTEACFFLVRKNQPMHVVARLRSIAEAVYEKRNQFRVGFELLGSVAPDGSITPLSTPSAPEPSAP